MSVTALPGRGGDHPRRPVPAGRPVAVAPAVTLPPMPRTAPGGSPDRVGAQWWSADGDDDARDRDNGEVYVRSVPIEDPATWSATLVKAAVEALTGSRPAAQLARWLTAELYDSLARRAGLAVRINGRPSLVRQAAVRGVRVCRLSPLVAEASVVVHDGIRVRAAAIRVEAHRGRWRATALEIG